MKALLAALLLLAIAHLIVRRLSAPSLPPRPAPDSALDGCSEEGFDATWLSHLARRPPNRGHRHG